MNTLVGLSSGETFYVSSDPDKVAGVLSARKLVRVGNRVVNPQQVTQLQPVREVPSIHSPEHLEAVDGAVSK